MTILTKKQKKTNKLIYLLCMEYKRNYINTIDFIEYAQILEGTKLPHILPKLKNKIRNF